MCNHANGPDPEPSPGVAADPSVGRALAGKHGTRPPASSLCVPGAIGARSARDWLPTYLPVLVSGVHGLNQSRQIPCLVCRAQPSYGRGVAAQPLRPGGSSSGADDSSGPWGKAGENRNDRRVFPDGRSTASAARLPTASAALPRERTRSSRGS
jgi:hypothetical protein